jgi:phospholipid/cholesterol/gamma-HCH transport system permease protein
MTRVTPAGARLLLAREADGILRVRLSGRWTLAEGVPPADEVVRALEPGSARVVLAAGEVGEWDSALVAYVHDLTRVAGERGVAVDNRDLPAGARRLLDLALAVPPRPGAPAPADDHVLARVGRSAIRAEDTARDALGFLGDLSLGLARLARGRARVRGVDLLRAAEAAGAGALGIVALVGFLIGGVVAFVGALQLQPFGASIYVANLVGIGMTRELAPLMTGIVMAGRTGAAFAAVLGTMTLNEEVDALSVMALRPVEFLVLPRVLGVALMTPLLVAYADLVGLAGGMVVGVTLLQLSAAEYLRQTQESVALRHVLVGLGKGAAFGILVALAGCFYGLRAPRSAAAVGEAATRAVVTAIVLIVVVDAAFTVLLHLVHQ